jgi:Domain of unknown function (DUF3846)
MNYLLSNENKFTLEIEAEMKRSLKDYVIVEKKETVNEWTVINTYDLYEIPDKERSIDYSNQTLSGFSRNYLHQPLKSNEEITTVSIYHNGEIIKEFGLPIKIVVFEPNKPGYIKEIEHTGLALSEIVDGEVEHVYLGREDMILVCNEVGLLRNLPKHRGFHGTFLIMGLHDGKTVSLTDMQIKEAIKEFDKKQNYESKSKYLQQYFQKNDVPRKVFSYEFENISSHIGTESIIEFLLLQESKEQLQMIELEIRDIERNQKDIYPYLKTIGYQMAKRQNKSFL